MKIDSLTPEQAAILPKFRSEWFRWGTNTDRADRAKAEAAIMAMRAEIGITSKPFIMWCSSPATCAMAVEVVKSEHWRALIDELRSSVPANLWANLRANLWDNLGANLWDNLGANLGANLRANLVANLRANLWANLRANLWDNLGANLGANLRANLGANLGANLRANLWDNLGDNLGANLWANLRANLWDNLGANLWDNLGANLGANLWGNLGDDLMANLNGAWYGQYESYWIAFYLFCRDVVGVKYDSKRSRQLDMWRDIAQSCCWWWCYENYVFISERPTVCEMTEQEGRLHCPDGPALAFADGYSLYRWHGVSVPEGVITHPESITVERIDAEENAEVRRVLLERFGEARYIEDSGATPIHRDKWGTLYRKEISGDEPLVMVRMKNSTVEPDGTRKVYYARVHPECRPIKRGPDGQLELGEPQRLTALNAIASTFGERGEDYKPEIET